NSLILAFKVAAGLGVAMAVACTTLAAKSARPERAPVAAALVGLNPVIVVHTVGGAHVDAWLAGLLAGALALAVRPRRTAFGAGAGAGRFVEFAVLAFFLFGFVAVFIRMARRDATVEPGPAHPAGAWGPALLLLALSLPYLLPWYAAWFVPFLGLLTDGLLMGIGTLVSVLLALTLVPADPFHG